MRENCTSGTVEGASGNGRSYSVRLKAKNMVTVGTKEYTHKLLLAA